MKNINQWNDSAYFKIKKRINSFYLIAEKDIKSKWAIDDDKTIKKLKKITDNIQNSTNYEDKRYWRNEYQRALKNASFKGKRYKAMLEDITNDIHQLNIQSLDYVNESMPAIYHRNYNWQGKQIEKAIKVKFDKIVSFTIYNKHALEILADDRIPIKKIKGAKDSAWIERQIKNQIAQGIIQGEPYKKMANRIGKVIQTNKKTAMRWARTSTTSTLNKARLDNMSDAQDKGVILVKVWHSVRLPMRTRDWHATLHNKEKPINEPFENEYGEIMYPGDSKAHPANIENCMCRLEEKVIGYKPTLKKGVIEVIDK